MAIVSVIIPTHNRAHTLKRAVDSVLNQSFTDFELVVVDDGSTDETPALLDSFSDPRLRVLRQANRGVSAARNQGVRESGGKWLAFLDSDDEWLPEKLEKQFSFAKAHSGLELIHGNEIWIRNGVRVNPMNKHQKRGGDVFADALRLCCISPSTAMLQRSLFNKHGGFREDFTVCEDYDLWLKITSQQPVGYVEDFLIKKYGGHEDQLSRRYFAMDYWRVLSIAQLLEEGQLVSEQKQLAIKQLRTQSKVLLKGYRKHQNLVNYDQIFTIFNKY